MKAEESIVKNKNHMLMVVEIMQTGNWLDSKISKVLAESGITHIQFNILRILEGSHPLPLSVGAIKERIVFSKSDITRLLDRLKGKGLIDRNVNPENRRSMDVSITQKGLALIKFVLPRIEEELDGFYSEKVSLTEMTQIKTILKKIRS